MNSFTLVFFSAICVLAFGKPAEKRMDHPEGIEDGSAYYATVTPHVIMVGGWDGTTVFSDVEVFPDYGCSIPPIPAVRWAQMAGVLQQQLIVCGGFNQFFQRQSDCWQLDLLQQSEWKAIASLPEGLSTASMTTQGGTLYIMGGDDGQSLDELSYTGILSYHIGDSEWHLEEEGLTAARMGSCALTSDDWVVITGGTPTFQLVQRSKMDGTWEDLPSTNELERLGHGCTQAMFGKELHIIVAGGENAAWDAVYTAEHIIWEGIHDSHWEYLAELPLDHRSGPGVFDTKKGTMIVGGWTTTLQSAYLSAETNEWEISEETLIKGRWGSANVYVLSPSVDAYCGVDKPKLPAAPALLEIAPEDLVDSFIDNKDW